VGGGVVGLAGERNDGVRGRLADSLAVAAASTRAGEELRFFGCKACAVDVELGESERLGERCTAELNRRSVLMEGARIDDSDSDITSTSCAFKFRD
jgi:hypothetical protein